MLTRRLLPRLRGAPDAPSSEARTRCLFTSAPFFVSAFLFCFLPQTALIPGKRPAVAERALARPRRRQMRLRGGRSCCRGAGRSGATFVSGFIIHRLICIDRSRCGRNQNRPAENPPEKKNHPRRTFLDNLSPRS